MKNINILLLAAGILFFTSCETKTFTTFQADHELIRYSGRVDHSDVKQPLLISSASSVEFNFTGDSCIILLRKLNPPGEHNYVSIELDGTDQGRLKIENDSLTGFTIKAESPETHNVKIFKSTEANNNQVAFGGVLSYGLQPLSTLLNRKIEFIGNSITCGMGNDPSDVPCNTALWFDQHNAYWAYGPFAARELNAQALLSSVSGIGIYRNWNSLSPVMPDVYENMYLNTDDAKKWDFHSYQPDLVSICLGTNDMSLGDGTSERLPFDSTQYVTAYIEFVNKIYSKYPETQVCLLTSPMVHDENGELLKNCLDAVADNSKSNHPDKKEIAVFEFPSHLEPHGCDYHPDIDDHKQMAEALVPFYKEVMGW